MVGMRKHWFIFLLEISGLIIAALLPFVLIPFYQRIMPTMVATVGVDRFDNLMVFMISAWELVVVMGFFISLTGYYLDILIVTNQRLIDVDQVSLFSRDIAVAPLQQVQDVKVEVLGIFATFFKFGNIHIQSAGERREMVIKGIRYPEYARDVLMKAYHEATHQK